MLFKTKPMEHQINCYDKSKEKPYFAVFADMGTGKTKIAIDTFIHMFIEQEVDHLLVIAPKGNYLNWIDELKLHSFYPFKLYTHKGLKIEWKIQDNTTTHIPVYLMNIEAFATDKGWGFANKIVDAKTMLVIDESTKIKSPKIQRTKLLLKLAERTQYKRILTGYPAPNNIVDLFTQFAFLDKGITQCSSWYGFRNTFCQLIPIQMGGNRPSFHKIIGTQNLDILQQRITPYSFRIKKEECLDLPDKTYQRYEFEMSKVQQKAYAELRQIAITELSSNTVVTTPSVISQILRLQQVVCGFVGTSEEGNYIFPENPRLKALEDIVDLLINEDKQVIIWSHFIQCIRDIKNVMVKSYGADAVVTYYGIDNDAARMDSLSRFKNGEARIFIGNPSVAGFGLTLTNAHNAIYYSNSYNLEHRLQSEDRIHRIGQSKKCLYIDIMARGTIDEKIASNLRAKKKIGDLVLGDEWKDWI